MFFLVGRIGLEKGHPVGVQLDQDGIGDFARQRTIGFVVFQAVKDGRVGQVGALLKKMLANLVVGLIIQVFGSQSSLINSRKTWITLADQMLFNQSHWFPPV